MFAIWLRKRQAPTAVTANPGEPAEQHFPVPIVGLHGVLAATTLVLVLLTAAGVGDVKLSYLVKGLPGHPLHPPLTDLTIGTYSFATIAAILDVAGIVQRNAAYGWWIALVVGLCSTVLTATTGFIDWLEIEWGSELWKTATLHVSAMLAATGVFLAAALVGHHGYTSGTVSTGAFVLTLVGFALLTTGGWLGGAVVFVHGMRVLNLVSERFTRASAPVPPEQAAAPRD